MTCNCDRYTILCPILNMSYACVIFQELCKSCFVAEQISCECTTPVNDVCFPFRLPADHELGNCTIFRRSIPVINDRCGLSEFIMCVIMTSVLSSIAFDFHWILYVYQLGKYKKSETNDKQ